jgi:hypothetical protein
LEHDGAGDFDAARRKVGVIFMEWRTFFII